MRTSFWAGIILSALLLVGCNQAETRGGIPNPHPAKRIVSLSPSTTELASMSDPDIVVGRTSSCNYPKDTKAEIVADVKPHVEKIIALKPDLIVADKALYSDADLEAVKTIAKVDVLVLDAQTFDQYRDFLTRLASRIGNETYISEQLDKMRFAIVQNRLPSGVPSPKVLVLSGDGTGSPYAAGTKTFVADIIHQLGATPVGPDATNYQPVSPETMIGLAPDLIVTAGKPESLLADSRYQSIPAIKLKQVYGVDGDVLLRSGSRVQTLIDGLGKIIARTKVGAAQ